MAHVDYVPEYNFISVQIIIQFTLLSSYTYTCIHVHVLYVRVSRQKVGTVMNLSDDHFKIIRILFTTVSLYSHDCFPNQFTVFFFRFVSHEVFFVVGLITKIISFYFIMI